MFDFNGLKDRGCGFFIIALVAILALVFALMCFEAWIVMLL